MPFVDVEARECIEHVSDKEDEEGMNGNRSFDAWSYIDMCEQFHVILPSMPKNINFYNFHNASINSFLKPM